MSVGREAWESALGQIVLLALEDNGKLDLIPPIVESNAIRTLQKIQDILNNEELSDFECIEEIVLAFEHAGFSTSRHDFG